MVAILADGVFKALISATRSRALIVKYVRVFVPTELEAFGGEIEERDLTEIAAVAALATVLPMLR